MDNVDQKQTSDWCGMIELVKVDAKRLLSDVKNTGVGRPAGWHHRMFTIKVMVTISGGWTSWPDLPGRSRLPGPA